MRRRTWRQIRKFHTSARDSKDEEAWLITAGLGRTRRGGRERERERERGREMGQHQHQHNPQYQHHPAVDGLLSLFIKAHHDLSLVHLKLDKEFNQIYPDNANPMKLVVRIKKIQDELSSLKDQCRELLTAKQELIDKASSILVGNRSMLQRMQASVGISMTSSSEDPAYSSFNQIIEEWTAHVRSGTGNAEDETAPEDINNLLFASIVRST